MSEIEQLESLSNAEIRKKCLEYGLPNVPVTSSSRKVLIKKIAAILSEPSDGKKVNRRETIHVSGPMTPSKNVTSSAPAKEGTPSRTNRRTIAVPAVVEDKEELKVDDKANPPAISGRRRSLAQKTLAETEEPAPKPAPIGERRRSVRGESQTKITLGKVNVDKPTETIEEVDEGLYGRRPEKRSSAVRETAPVQRKPDYGLEAGSLVILESDEEDDGDLVVAAEQAEKNIRSQIPTAVRGNSRAPSLSKSNVYTSSYPSASTQGASKPIRKTIQEEEPYQKSYKSGAQLFSSESSNSEFSTATQRSSYAGFSSSQPSRTSTVYSSARLSSLAAAPSSSTYRPSVSSYSSTLQNRPAAVSSQFSSTLRASTFINEQSDDNDIELDPKDTPYLSQFARNLQRLTAENTPSKVALSSRYRSSIYPNKNNTSLSGQLREFWINLDHKYKISLTFKIAMIIIFIIFIYVMFFA